MERKLAHIEKIKAIEDIVGADKIQVAKVLGWKVVVRKNEFKPGDSCVFFEIDSILKRDTWNEFLFKHPEDTNYRLKTCRMRGSLSQGLVLPISSFTNTPLTDLTEGTDVTEILGVVRYEPAMSASLAGDVKGSFPPYIPKTDEYRLQSAPGLLQEFKDKEVYVTQKIDGTSGTFSCIHGEIDVCSRNLSLKNTGGNTYWEVNKKYGITDKLLDIYNKTGKSYGVQSEVHGESIQKNRLGIKGHNIAVFSIYDVDNCRFLDYADFVDFCKKLELPIVPVLYTGIFKWNTVEEMLEFAKGKYASGQHQEGIVIRPVKEFRSDILGGRASFKVINNEYLEKGGE